MIKLIADSGSTKCAWRLISSDGEQRDVITTGINPFFRTTEGIYDELLEKLIPVIGVKVDEIFFYGSGIINEEKADVIRRALSPLFPGARLFFYSDVVAASRALFGKGTGLACILGTGSNVCLYNGTEVVSAISPLGFILGDECSGAVLGRKLLGDYFKQVMPPVLRTEFEKRYGLSREEALQRVYKMERPNLFLASFTPFLSAFPESEYARQLIRSSLAEFFERNVTKIPDYQQYAIGFVGSVAYYFREFVEETCENYGLTCVAIRKEPMEALVGYHMQSK
ncbi:MAG: ATPase [Marinilabiliales bacterium]|nr:ATPase [Marinilabiliales bacterium]